MRLGQVFAKQERRITCARQHVGKPFMMSPTPYAISPTIISIFLIPMLAVKEGFYELAEFPSVLGAIDGTLVPIQAPSVDEHHFVCRKRFHAINVQVIGDANLMILNLVAKWPGSTHDAFMWSNCDICHKFENGEIQEGWLLGDSAYPLRPWMLTPILNATTAGEKRYNRYEHFNNGILLYFLL